MSLATTETASSSDGSSVRRIRALHVINGLFTGGGHKSMLILMNALERHGGTETRLCLLGKGPASFLAVRDPVVLDFDGRYNNLRVLRNTAVALGRVIDEWRPDILHTHGLDADLVGSIAAINRPIVHISHLRISPPTKPESWKAAIRRLLFRFLTWRSGTWFVAVSEAVRQQMSRYYWLPLDRIITVRNGIDVDEYPGRGADVSASRSEAASLIIGTAGRLAPMKGFEHLLDACNQLYQIGVRFELRIAGSGTLRHELERRAAQLRISDTVTFVGNLSEMADFYESLDVFVLPSVSTEGLPLVVLESMAMQTAVIATDLAGAPEVITPDVDGILVPPGDSCALAIALERLSRDTQLRMRLAVAGQQRVRSDFSVERVGREVKQIYDQRLSIDN